MLIVTSEYIFQNPKLKEISNILDKTILEHNKKLLIFIVEKSTLNLTLSFLIKYKTKQIILLLIVE